MKKKFRTRAAAMLLAIFTVIGILPVSTTAYAAEPEIMPTAAGGGTDPYNNKFLDALQYAGYDVEYQRSHGTLFKKDDAYPFACHWGWNLQNQCPDEYAIVKSDIPYGAGASCGTAMTAGSSKTGLVPDIARLKTEGIECGGYVSYVFLNYLPNIEGIEVPGLKAQLPNGTHSPYMWETALQNMVAAGQAQRIANTNNALKLSETFTADWKKKVRQYNVPIFSGGMQKEWMLQFDFIIAEALEKGPLRNTDIMLTEETIEYLKEQPPKDVPKYVLQELAKYYLANKPEKGEWVELPQQNFSAYFGNTMFDKKWITKLPESVIERKSLPSGVCKYRMGV